MLSLEKRERAKKKVNEASNQDSERVNQASEKTPKT
jgi:hypothetical protein